MVMVLQVTGGEVVVTLHTLLYLLGSPPPHFSFGQNLSLGYYMDFKSMQSEISTLDHQMPCVEPSTPGYSN